MRRRTTLRSVGPAVAVVVASLLAVLPAPASATFHEMSVREVYSGSVAEPNARYVELQMWNQGQNLVGGHVLHTYTAAGAETSILLPSDVPNSANQSTILIGTPQVTTQFGVNVDAELSPSAQLEAGGGAVCWESLDCVSWGSFSHSLPSPAGTPAAAIPDGMALRRTIAPGCATLLELADDRNNSAQDFSAVFPSPRPNSVAPTEHACTSGGGGGGGGQGGGTNPPQTFLRHKPGHRTRDRTPTFRFAADETGVTFQCKLDRGRFRSCHSPFTTKRLKLGRHTFAVRARDESGNVDRTPASYAFRVLAH
jgi:hypothetical protein